MQGYNPERSHACTQASAIPVSCVRPAPLVVYWHRNNDDWSISSSTQIDVCTHHGHKSYSASDDEQASGRTSAPLSFVVTHVFSPLSPTGSYAVKRHHLGTARCLGTPLNMMYQRNYPVVLQDRRPISV